MDILNKITSNFNNDSYNWVPHVAFISFLFLSILIGFAMSRRTALYFGIGMILSIIISIITTVLLVNFTFAQFIPKNLKIGTITYSNLLSTNKPYLDVILFFPIFLIIVALVLVLQLTLFIILRKKVFKKRLISLKEKGQSAMIFRFHGSLVALAFVTPLAFIVSSYLASMGNGSSSLFYSKAVMFITAGQINSPTEKIRELMLVSSSASVLLEKVGALQTLLGDSKANPNAIVDLLSKEDGRNAVKTIILSKFVNENIALLTGQLTPSQIANIDLSSPTPDISWVHKIDKSYSVHIPEKDFNSFTKLIADNLKKTGAKISPEGLRYLLINTNIISI